MAYFTRAELDRNAPTRALLPLLDPEEGGTRLDAHHRLIWTLFPSSDEKRRDFLWRADGHGRFYILSQRRPEQNDLFRPFRPKTFAPAIGTGDRLAFVLRANATKERPRNKLETDGRHRRVDVVMHALKDIPGRPSNPPPQWRSARAQERFALARQEGEKWLRTQGTRNGFALEDFILEDYSVVPLLRPDRPRKPREQQPKLGILDMRGVLTVTEPETFTARLLRGFGRARGFGCGLMLIRRV